jgi:hypothetical protein
LLNAINRWRIIKEAINNFYGNWFL